MASITVLLVSFASLAMAADPEDDRCVDEEPRLELRLLDSPSGEFYEGDTVRIEVYLRGLCEFIPGHVDNGGFYFQRECVEDDAACPLVAGSRGAGAFFIAPQHGQADICSLWGDCGPTAPTLWRQSRAIVMGTMPPCLVPLPISEFGGVYLGTIEIGAVGLLPEEGRTWRVTAGDDRDECVGGVAAFHMSAVDGGVLVGPADPVEYRERRRPFVRGDANLDGVVDMSDAVLILDVLFVRHRLFSCANAADVDDNNEHEITDAIALLGFLFLGGDPPPVPFPEAGYDRTPRFSPEESTGCFSGAW